MNRRHLEQCLTPSNQSASISRAAKREEKEKEEKKLESAADVPNRSI